MHARTRILFPFGIQCVRARRPGQYRFISRVMVCLDSQHVLRPNKNALSKRITFIFFLIRMCFVDDHVCISCAACMRAANEPHAHYYMHACERAAWENNAVIVFNKCLIVVTRESNWGCQNYVNANAHIIHLAEGTGKKSTGADCSIQADHHNHNNNNILIIIIAYIVICIF